MIVLDTDVMVDLWRRYTPAVTWLTSIPNEEIILPGFVVMELIQGCQNRAEQERLEKWVGVFMVDWPSPEVCDKALAVFSRFYLSHHLGIIDSLIGHLAIAWQAPLCTFNQKHYAVIPNLQTLQPYSRV